MARRLAIPMPNRMLALAMTDAKNPQSRALEALGRAATKAEKRLAFEAAVKAGAPIKGTADTLGVPESTARSWRKVVLREAAFPSRRPRGCAECRPDELPAAGYRGMGGHDGYPLADTERWPQLAGHYTGCQLFDYDRFGLLPE